LIRLGRVRSQDRTFSTLFTTLAQASSLHHDVNAFYDIPSISVREGILPKVLDSPETEMPKWFRTGDDVTFDDESKVRDWGGVAVDVMHVREPILNDTDVRYLP